LYFSSWFCPHLCAGCRALTHKGKDMDVHEFQCVKNRLYVGTFYPIFLLKGFLHLIPFLLIFMNYFQFNLIPSWSCLLRKLAWLLGLLYNWK
jgi:hypothetical protein